jgi:hypothetical protein
MALVMSELITKGSDKHPKQSYNVGKKCVDQVIQANCGKVKISEATRVVTTGKASSVVLAALMVFFSRAFAFDSFDALGLALIDLGVSFSSLALTAAAMSAESALLSESLFLLLSIRMSWIV